jgi:hypothetical protein
MLVNDRKEYNNSYVGMSPQFQPLRMQIKQSYRVIDSVCIKETLLYQVERKTDSGFDSTKSDTHNSARRKTLC